MKRICFLGFVTLLFISFVMPCFAVGDFATAPSPRYTYIGMNSYKLEIEESTGTAYCSSYCCTDEGYAVQVVYKLQQYTGTRWATLKTWYASGTQCAGLSGEWPVMSGYTYRAYVTFSVRNSAGNLLDSDTIIYECVYPAQ